LEKQGETMSQSWEVDGRGHFLIEGVAPGNYDLFISSWNPNGGGGITSPRQTVIVTADSRSDVEISLDLASKP
jgi:hypothetical protein